MPSLKFVHIILLALGFFNCSSVQIPPLLYPASPPETLISPPPPEYHWWKKSSHPDTIAHWIPRYVSTGISSGIMVEYTGFKSDKPVNARYAFLELAQPDNDSTFGEMRTRINDLRQAFFTLPPGTYIVRHTTPWAEQKFIGNVTVKDGEYSIISVTVLIPPQAR